VPNSKRCATASFNATFAGDHVAGIVLASIIAGKRLLV